MIMKCYLHVILQRAKQEERERDVLNDIENDTPRIDIGYNYYICSHYTILFLSSQTNYIA